MNESLSNMIKGLILHYLNQGTLEEAIEQGQAAGLPEELLASLPGMVFEVTSAAGAIILGAHTEESIVEELEKRARSSGGGAEFNRKDAAALIKLTVGFMNEFMADDGGNEPVPELKGHWYQYGM